MCDVFGMCNMSQLTTITRIFLFRSPFIHNHTITGVVSDVNKDGTYNIVQVETGVIWKNLKSPKDFAAYKSYENGVKAVYRQNEQEYVPITIKAFNPFSAKEGWELLVSAFYRFISLLWGVYHLIFLSCVFLFSHHKIDNSTGWVL